MRGLETTYPGLDVMDGVLTVSSKGSRYSFRNGYNLTDSHQVSGKAIKIPVRGRSVSMAEIRSSIPETQRTA